MIVVDVETTGIDPKLHSILSIGACDFSNPLRTFYGECRIRDGAECQDEALEINGFTREQINDPAKKDQKELIKEFCDWYYNTQEKTLAGHNVYFDAGFLQHAINLCNIKLHLGKRNVDTHSLTYAHIMSRGLVPPINNGRSDITSDFVFEYVGIGREQRPHKALTGAKMEAESISRLIYGRPLLEEYRSVPVPEYLHSK